MSQLPPRKQRQRIASYALITAQDKILLTLAGLGTFKGSWALPGGGVDFGEDPNLTIGREVKEETGLDINQFKLEGVIAILAEWIVPEGHNEELHNVGIIFSATLDRTLPVKEDADGLSSLGAKWFSFEELKKLPLSSTTKEALKFLKF